MPVTLPKDFPSRAATVGQLLTNRLAGARWAATTLALPWAELAAALEAVEVSRAQFDNLVSAHRDMPPPLMRLRRRVYCRPTELVGWLARVAEVEAKVVGGLS